MYLISLAFFAVFVANICMGAFGDSTFLSDVGEMLVLFAASLFFVAGILKSEAAAKKKNQSN